SFNKNELEFINSYIQQEPENCYFYFHRIENESYFNSIICICDIIFAVYKDFIHSSNLVTKAAFFEKPILVSEGYCMAKRVKNYRLGLTVEQDNIEKIIVAIRKLTNFKLN